MVACDLIERYGFAACIRGVSTLKERNLAMLDRKPDGIVAPLPYLRKILEETPQIQLAPERLEYSIGDMS